MHFPEDLEDTPLTNICLDFTSKISFPVCFLLYTILPLPTPNFSKSGPWLDPTSLEIGFECKCVPNQKFNFFPIFFTISTDKSS